MFKTRFDKWLDNYECDLAIAFDNQTKHNDFNAFIKAEYKTMLENERERTCTPRDELLGFKTTK